jgi:gliding motility-associated-like protein
MRRILILILLLAAYLSAPATHNRAGEITYRHLENFKYELTITTYTYTLSPADRRELEVDWGDNTKSIAPRVDSINLPDFYRYNRYVATHIFPGAGTYEILVQDPNRNFGIGNIPNSVNIVFAIKTTLVINPMPGIGFNNSPVLLYPPKDKAALHQKFIHNPQALDSIDHNSDSLSYELTTCLGMNGIPIPDYSIPLYDNAFYVDAITGDLVWDSPTQLGKYNVAMKIKEWRHGVLLSTIIRDMQIEVLNSDNDPPVIEPLHDICVEAGNTIQFIVSASDPNGNVINLSAIGGPFLVDDSPAHFTPIPSQPGSNVTKALFTWHTNCSHVQKQAYQVGFIAKDTLVNVQLVDIKNVDITVISPAPKNLTSQPSNNSILLSWDHCVCTQAKGYRLFRRAGSSAFIPDSCETGVPPYTGYQKIADNQGLNNTTFNDTNNGQGLTQGIEYCYRVIAYFEDGAESYTSEEHCTSLVRGIPVITNVSVKTTSATNGSMYVAWAKPTELDTLAAPGPYKYLVYRSNDYWGSNFSLIASLYQNGLNDTIYNDTMLNTYAFPYSYKIELYNDQPGNQFLVGAPQIASSVFVTIAAEDNRLNLHFNKNVPWLDTLFVVYRRNNLTGLYDSIGVSDNTSYIDSDLKNGETYCYKVKSIGKYTVQGMMDPIINYSQEACAIPVDTMPPCPVPFIIAEHCDIMANFLNWINPNSSCTDDVTGYNIYFSPTLDGQLQLIATIDSAGQTTYTHIFPEGTSTIAGCYAITAIDSFLNESPINRQCIDSCKPDYKLPNVFTPNNDEFNQLYHPIMPYHFIEKVDMKIYNRWGVLVFKTEDPDINWDGRYMENDKMVSDGVYYYVCDVYTKRLVGLWHSTLVGFIHVFTGSKNQNQSK